MSEQGQSTAMVDAGLAEAVAAAESLHALLQEETQALEGRDSEAIERLAAAKLDGLQRLTAADAERYLRQSPEETRSRPLLERLRGALAEIQVMNDRNGRRIAQRMQTVERELAILHGAVEVPENGAVYSSSGRHDAAGRSRSITQA